MAIHRNKGSILDAGAGSEHSSNIFTQLLLSLSGYKMVDSKL
jgi:hypothetical protein